MILEVRLGVSASATLSPEYGCIQYCHVKAVRFQWVDMETLSLFYRSRALFKKKVHRLWEKPG